MPHHSRFISTDRIKKGQHSEFVASAWLIKNNYRIYWKTQDNDPMDLVAIHRVTGGVKKIDASGSIPSEKRIKPYPPIFSKTPAKITEPAVGAST